MGKRARRRGQQSRLQAATSDYRSGGGDVLELRGSLTAATRRAYGATLHGGLQREDAWHRGVELLFERLAVSWTISDVPTTGQHDLLARLRAATPDERAWVRDVLREHCAEHFPELQAP